uniref:Transcription antitermination protein NusB n=1 Tax=Ammonifex degensii TaxID=42838 RepID=A0A7C2EIW3_9THEO
MGRRRARGAAFVVLFQVDVGRAEAAEALAYTVDSWKVSGPDREFVQDVVSGVLQQQEWIDGIITELSRDWRLERMNSADRNIMRVALYELLYRDDIPPNVAVNEAVELAKRYGGEESPRFVNGILGKVVEKLAGYKAGAK